VAKGQFRADLAHRLSGMILTVPTLAERVDDIPVLVEHFVRRAQPSRAVAITRSAMQILQMRVWPGNVRELKQVVEAALAFARNVLDDDALTVVLAQRSRTVDATKPTPTFVERQRLLKLLNGAAWDTGIAASTLGVHRATVYRRMRRLGIPVPSGGNYPRTDFLESSHAPSFIGGFAGIRGDLHDGGANAANAIV
jgi:DNA-binding NtrC family response regulator